MKNEKKIRSIIQTKIENKHINTMDDLLFKFVFGKEERRHFTIDFLNSVLSESLGHRISDIEFSPTEQIPYNKADKAPRLDVACRLDTGELVDVEVQVVNRHNMDKRTLAYWTYMYSTGLHAGEDYREASPAITINILAFSIRRKAIVHSSCSIRWDDEPYERFSENLRFHFLEIKKFLRAARNKPASEMTRMERWMGYLAFRSKKRKQELAMCDDVISKAYDACDVFFSSMEERMNYINNEIARMDYRADIQDAEERGIKIGEERGEERGIKIGEERGENRLLRLMQLLTAQNRNDDISRIMTDKAYLQELYRAYSI